MSHKNHLIAKLEAQAGKNYDRRGYAKEYKAFQKGGEFLLEELKQLIAQIPEGRNTISYLSIVIPHFKIKGAFMSITKKRSDLKDDGDGVKYVSGSITPETNTGQIEKVKDGSVTAASDNEGAVVSVDTADPLKWKAVIDVTKFPFKAKLSFKANADLVDGGSIDEIAGEVDLEFIEDEATQLVVNVD